MSTTDSTPRSVPAAGESGGGQLPDPKRWLALGMLLLATFMGMLDVFIVNVAAPSIQSSLGASFGQIQFVVAGYVLAYAVGLVTGGRIGDALGRRRVFLIGLIAFGATSLLCAVAPSAAALIAFRVVQGLAAALMLPQVLAILQVVFPAEERAKALGLYGATIGLGSIAGQIVGGALIKLDLAGWDWRSVFLVNVPVTVIAALGAAASVREVRGSSRARIDYLGVLLLAAALLLLLWPLVVGADNGWPAWGWGALAGAVVCFALFMLWERRIARVSDAGHALLPPRLFGHPGFAKGLPTALVFYSGNAGLFLILSYFLQDGLKLSPLASGVVFLPLGAAFALASLQGKKLVARWGSAVLVLAAVVMAAGLVLVRLPVGSGSAAHQAALVTPGLLLCGLGQGLIAPSLIGLVLGGVAQEDAGAASGGLLTATQIANALGYTVVGGIFNALRGDGTYGSAFQDTLWLLCALALAAGALLWWLRPRQQAAAN
ncbi:MFS transporter [Streptomyces sp. NEAU-sy36]|uniref:MFS transporter n=1 Tax=unclassified Streptomyces TaxID=2593676 RepID=UPI0015D63D31|nr:MULTISPECIES: MFS transporter [unclassified Streptomyces]QLI99907.1 MFS transporter [Streptomyces sp. NEAU-sy36]